MPVLTPAAVCQRGRAVLASMRRGARTAAQRRDLINATVKLANSGHVNYRTTAVPLTATEIDRRHAALVAVVAR